MIRALIFLLAIFAAWAQAKTIAYVSNAEDGTIGVYALDQDKATLIPQGAVAAGAAPMPMAVSPDRHFLYVAMRKEPFRVISYAIGPDGGLTKKTETPLPDNMAYIATDRTGRWLFGASYFGDKISVSPIGGAASQILPTGRNAHSILADPTNRFVYSANLGADQILQYRFDASSGTLSENTPSLIKTEAGEGPRHMVFSPDGRFLYVLTELGGDVLQFALDAERGTLTRTSAMSIFPAGRVPTKIWAADLKITPNGRFLYASERTTSRIAQFALDEKTGAPRLMGTVPTETQPRGIAISPSGRFLVASGEKSDRLSLYRIEEESGRLTPTARAPAGKGANWVEIIDLP